MSTVGEIIKAVERLDADDFLKLRGVLDRVEEKLWARELDRATARYRRGKLTDAKIDQLIVRRRQRARLRQEATAD
jgi:hypothetical protein